MHAAGSGSRLVVGKPARRGDLALCLDAFELEAARAADARAIAFDEVMDGGGGEGAECDRAEIRVPVWRGYRFLRALEWLLRARLMRPGTEVVWEVPRRVAKGVARELGEAGWTLERSREQDVVSLIGSVPVAEEGVMAAAEPLSFEGEVLGRQFRFAADWGVFSQGAVDPGTALLAEVAATVGSASIADVGTGYGPLAIALAATGDRQGAARVVASEIDSVALWLARRNARENRVEVEFSLTANPRTLPKTDLTICNFPTHAAPANRQVLLRALEARGRGGSRLLIGCHKSLAPRFTGLALDHPPGMTYAGEHAAILY